MAVVAGVLVLATPAVAGKPTREPLPISDEAFSGVCSFTVARHVLANNPILTTYNNGDQRITGTFKQRLTTLTTGEFIDVNSSDCVARLPRRRLTHGDRLGQAVLASAGPAAVDHWTGRMGVRFGGNFVSFTQRGGTSACSLVSPPPPGPLRRRALLRAAAARCAHADSSAMCGEPLMSSVTGLAESAALRRKRAHAQIGRAHV